MRDHERARLLSLTRPRSDELLLFCSHTREELLSSPREPVIVLDVRPEEESEDGHIPGARSIPVEQLEERLEELPKDKEIVAYCRGPYCVYSDDTVRRLREEGRDARRLEEGLPDWAIEGRPVEDGTG